MNRIVVSDTSALIALAKIDALYILRQLYREILIPEAVYAELRRDRHSQPGACQIINNTWIKRIPVENQTTVIKLNNRLDIGESEAIALAIQLNADLLIIDEKLGRKIALKFVHTIIGVMGILLEAKKANIISSVEPFLKKLKCTGFRINPELFEFVLSQAGELTNKQQIFK